MSVTRSVVETTRVTVSLEEEEAESILLDYARREAGCNGEEWVVQGRPESPAGNFEVVFARRAEGAS